MLEAYDYLLIVGNLTCLILLFTLLALAVKKTTSAIKLIAIFGVLFFVTALIGGSAVTGFVTKDVMEDKLITTTVKIDESNTEIATFKSSLSEIKKSVENAESFEEKNQLLNQIVNLEKKLDNLLDTNKDLEDDLDDLKDEIKELYALIPGGHY